MQVEANVDNEMIVLDYLGKGAILRPNHFLVNRVNRVRYTVLRRCLIYTLSLQTITLLCVDYPELRYRIIQGFLMKILHCLHSVYFFLEK